MILLGVELGEQRVFFHHEPLNAVETVPFTDRSEGVFQIQTLLMGTLVGEKIKLHGHFHDAQITGL